VERGPTRRDARYGERCDRSWRRGRAVAWTALVHFVVAVIVDAVAHFLRGFAGRLAAQALVHFVIAVVVQTIADFHRVHACAAAILVRLAVAVIVDAVVAYLGRRHAPAALFFFAVAVVVDAVVAHLGRRADGTFAGRPGSVLPARLGSRAAGLHQKLHTTVDAPARRAWTVLVHGAIAVVILAVAELRGW